MPEEIVMNENDRINIVKSLAQKLVEAKNECFYRDGRICIVQMSADMMKGHSLVSIDFFKKERR